jgi:hypothetical protein
MEGTLGYHMAPSATAGAANGAEARARSAYNSKLSPAQEKNLMEAERINAVANRIADLSGRGEQLRRYL